MTLKFLIIRILCILFVLMPISAHSQKVGLVLSGGGAKGLAHIGVIQALEENDIPIDYVTGSSIGAIIGSLYAIGLSPQEMDSAFRSQQFRNWYRGKIDEYNKHFYKQYEMRPDMLNLNFEWKDSTIKPILPTNLVPTQPMDFGFLNIYARPSAACEYDFDKLMIPFRCVASDVYNDCAIILGAGHLGTAVRASMTFPFYFRPISIDNRVLFDGGIQNNFPQDVMRRDFNPDMIIGHKVSNLGQDIEEDDLMSQIENMIMGGNTNYHIPDSLGLLIENDFKDISLLDFQELDRLKQRGYEACMAVMPEIKERVQRRVPKDSVDAKRTRFKKKYPRFLIDNIYIQGVNRNQQEYIRRSLKQNKKLLDLAQFEEAYYRLIADNQIESARPVTKYNPETGFFDLYLNIRQERKYNLLFGTNISSTSVNQAFVGLEYKYLNRNAYYFDANLHFGRLYTSFQAGSRIDFPHKLPIYMKAKITNNRLDFFKSSTNPFFLDQKPAYLIQNETYFKLDMGFPMGVKSKMEIGGTLARNKDDYYQNNIFLQTDTADITRFDLVSGHITYERKTLDYKQYPTNGFHTLVQARYITGKERHIPGTTAQEDNEFTGNHQWLSAKLIHENYLPLSEWYSLGSFFSLNISNKPLFHNHTSSLLTAPAFNPTPHSKTLFLKNFRANNYASLGLRNIFNLTNSLHMRLEGYVFFPYQKILRESSGFLPYYSEPMTYYHYAGDAALVYQSPVGPVAFSINYYDEERYKWFFMFHFGYILFNERSLD